ncbi:MAG: hypothetical protein GY851_25590 [bacterium]|nr:hypothetical protein [bacterium]
MEVLVHTHTDPAPRRGMSCTLCEKAEEAAPRYVDFVEVAYRVAFRLTNDRSQAERLTSDALRSALDEEATGIRVDAWPKKRLLGHVRRLFLSQ